MKFSMNREQAIKIISEYSGILKENPVKPILAGLLISVKDNKVIFKGSNMEVELVRYSECKSESNGDVLIKPALLLEYIKLIEDEDIFFEKKNGFLTLNDAEFQILEDSQYPEIIELLTVIAAKENSLIFAKYLEKVKFINSSNSSDLVFNSIKMIFSNNTVEFASTDSHRLIYLKENITTILDKEALVPLESISIIYKLLKDFDDIFSISISDDRLILLWQDAYFSCKLLSVAYPDYKSLLNNFKSNKIMEFNRDDLNSSLKKVMSVTKNSNDSKNVATFNFKGNQLIISGISSSAKINQKVNMIKNGEDLKLGINCKYMKEYIDNISKNIVINATDPNSMLKITEDSNENYIYLLMPVNIRV